MTVLLDPDVGPASKTDEPVDAPVGPTFRLRAKRSGGLAEASAEAVSSGVTSVDDVAAQPNLKDRMKTTVQRLAKFAYDLLNDLF